MSVVNRLIGAVIDAALSPFAAWPPIVGLAAVSLAVTVLTLLVVRRVSNQQAIAAVKRRIEASLFEVRLFNEDVRALHGLRDALRHNLTYFRLSLAPLPWIIVPLTLLVAQLQFYYGYDGFVPGQSTVLKVRLKLGDGPAPPRPAITLSVPSGVVVETAPVWIPIERETAWRIAFERQGDYDLQVTVADRVVTKRVRVSDRVGWRTPGRYAAGWVSELFDPAEPSISRDAPIESIAVNYPARSFSAFGFSVGWLTVFLVLSLLFAWILRSRFDVVL